MVIDTRRSMLIPFFLLAACGFQPLHGTAFRESNAVSFAAVEVNTDSTHFGQLLKAEIEDGVNPAARATPKIYRLNISYKENEVPLFINPDGTSSRGDINFASSYTITRIRDGKLVNVGHILRTSSYNNSYNADYSSYVSQQDARKRAILELAQDYKLRLANLTPLLNNPDAPPVKPPDQNAAPEGPLLIHPQYEYENRNTGN